MSESSAVDAVWDYSVTKGCAWSENGAWEDADRDPIDITDAEIAVVVKSTEDSSGEELAEVTATVVSGPAGTFVIGQSVAEVDAIPAGQWYWSATLTPDGGEPQHLWHGMFEVVDVVEA